MLRFFILMFLTFACGRQSSESLRQGQLPVLDFPLYLTEGAPGRVWKLDRDHNKTLMAEGLLDPRGIATDRFGNVYVAEYGAGRVLKFPAGASSYEVLASDLRGPSLVSVDSFGAVFVAQDGATNIMRLSDQKVFASFPSVVSALAFGVDDIPLIGLFNENTLSWGWKADGPATVDRPNGVAVDGTGRVYVAQADPLAGSVSRFNPRDSGNKTLVASELLGPTGLAVDLVGNLFIVEAGASRIVLVTFDGKKFAWLTGVEDGQYLAFAQY